MTAPFQDGQIVTTDASRKALETHLLNSGLWQQLPEQGSENTHYVLSPCAYLLSKAQQRQLQNLAVRTYRSLSGIAERLCILAGSPSLTNEDARFLKLTTTATRGLLTPAAGVSDIPPVLKVDLVRRFDGMHQIVEVDAYNPRGFGYLALLDAMRPASANGYPGIAQFAELLRERAGAKDACWHIIVSDFERYYAPAMRILANALAAYGIDAKVVTDAAIKEDASFYASITHALVIPESLDRYSDVRATLLERYQAGTLTLLYPPTAYLGSKAFLPYLAGIPKMDRFIPKCGLVGRSSDPLPNMRGDLVLKGVSSSGMKQVFFSDLDPKGFFETFHSARSQKALSWLLQEQVRQVPIPVPVFTEDGQTETRMYYVRVTAYITADGMLGAEVTGRPDKMVHGARDCIQIPCVLE